MKCQLVYLKNKKNSKCHLLQTIHLKCQDLKSLKKKINKYKLSCCFFAAVVIGAISIN